MSSTTSPVISNKPEITVSTPKVENKVTAPKTTTKTTTPKTSQVASTKPKKDEIEYRVQFYYSRTQLPANSAKLKGIENVKFYKDGSGYKYTAGSTSSFDEAVKIQKRVRQKYKDAFVVRFKNGVRQ